MRTLLLPFFILLLSHCNSSAPESQSDLAHLKENPTILQPNDFAMNSKSVLIKDAKIMTATNLVYEKANMLMVNGKIQNISEQDIPVPEGTTTIDAQGMVATPGVIDVHSHMGVYPSPGVDAHSDGNEMGAPVTAQVWAEHGFWPQDPDLWRALAGGVTTIQVLPGSANLVGGRSFVAKLIPKLSAREMRFPGALQGLKMACGENPKRVHKDRGVYTRMGNVAGYRKAYQEALEYGREWQKYEKDKKQNKIPKRNFISETLLKVLKGEILVHFHCYRADDISAILDVAKEFGFKIRTIHHGLESYKVAERLKKEDVATATWADWWGFKAEAYDGIPYNAALLQEVGARAIIHSDSAIDVRFLNVEAGKALASAKKLGLNFSEDQALAWITKNAAWALGLDDKIGTLEVGKMADVVLWDGNPLSVYAKAQYVFINGEKVFDRPDKKRMVSDFEVGLTDMAFFDGREFAKPTVPQKINWTSQALEFPKPVSDSFVVKDVRAFVKGLWQDNVAVVVRDGVITDVTDKSPPQSLPVIDGKGQLLTPGLIESESMLGLFDISLDSRAQDLRNSSNTPTPDYKAVDSLNLRNTRIANKRQEGILTSLSRVFGDYAGSIGVAFDLQEDGVINEAVALYGRATKGGRDSKSRSATWSEIRQFIDDAKLYKKNPGLFERGQARDTMVRSRHLRAMQPVLEGKVPWVLRAHRADDISKVIDLKAKTPSLDLVISGGTEAWLVSDLLMKHDIPVMLAPSSQTPESFDKTRARFDQAAYLHSEGVKIIITDGNDNGAGRTRQEAGLAVKYGLPPEAALSAITETPAEVFKLNRGVLKRGAPANLVLWNGDPLEPTSWATRLWIQGQEKSLFNRHRALADKYLKKQ